MRGRVDAGLDRNASTSAMRPFSIIKIPRPEGWAGSSVTDHGGLSNSSVARLQSSLAGQSELP